MTAVHKSHSCESQELVLTARSSRSAGTFPCKVSGVSMEMDSAIHHDTLTRNGRGLAKGDNLIGNVVN